ncbi:pilus assembly PilX family protein [Variovorax saccharolyticus]|uniref:pilus assembly PilX family protein n=1 Tax=Variovorax saccharolyticus TaxID=3053516 RepID=UPI002576026F|nr:pilus assembly protein [Variovorax sp. J22R187]MDM0019952.1 pilus assembly protein [Variovorax sp. J22R187]
MTRAFDIRPARPAARVPAAARRETGASLIVVLLILVVVSILGVGGAQIASMAERGARNDRDMQIAWQASEAGLMDAEFDIGPGTSSRRAVFGSGKNVTAFVPNCGSDASSKNKGLCTLADTGKPAWLTVDFVTGTNVAQYGDYTGRSFASGNSGPQPFHKPRYIIEPIRDPGNRDLSDTSYIYRVTSMGFGPREDIQAVSQTIYRN